jgi:hypothetical protein
LSVGQGKRKTIVKSLRDFSTPVQREARNEFMDVTSICFGICIGAHNLKKKMSESSFIFSYTLSFMHSPALVIREFRLLFVSRDNAPEILYEI